MNKLFFESDFVVLVHKESTKDLICLILNYRSKLIWQVEIFISLSNIGSWWLNLLVIMYPFSYLDNFLRPSHKSILHSYRLRVFRYLFLLIFVPVCLIFMSDQDFRLMQLIQSMESKCISHSLMYEVLHTPLLSHESFPFDGEEQYCKSRLLRLLSLVSIVHIILPDSRHFFVHRYLYNHIDDDFLFLLYQNVLVNQNCPSFLKVTPLA